MKLKTYLISSVILLGYQSTSNGKSFSFGVVPQQAASKLAQKWAPLCQYLSLKTGHTIVFKTAPDIPEFEKRLAQKEYDFAYMNPYHYAFYSQRGDYQAMAKAKNKKINGIIVAPVGTKADLQQFQGKTLAFPSPAAFAASILTQNEFSSRGIHITPQYVSSHDSVYRGVAKGLFPAGGGVKRTFDNLDEQVRSQLQILLTTKGFTPHAIAHSSGVDKQMGQAVQTALVQMDQDPVGKKIVDELSIDGFETAESKDWDDVRALNIQILK